MSRGNCSSVIYAARSGGLESQASCKFWTITAHEHLVSYFFNNLNVKKKCLVGRLGHALETTYQTNDLGNKYFIHYLCIEVGRRRCRFLTIYVQKASDYCAQFQFSRNKNHNIIFMHTKNVNVFQNQLHRIFLFTQLCQNSSFTIQIPNVGHKIVLFYLSLMDIALYKKGIFYKTYKINRNLIV